MKTIRWDTINVCFKDAVKRMIPELNDCADLEVVFCNEILPCTDCNDGRSHSYFYRTKEEDKWIQVNEPGKCSKCRDREAFEDYQKKSSGNSKRLIVERLNRDYFHIPRALKDAGFKNYQETDKVTTRAKDDVIHFIKDFMENENYNLLIMGNTGTGKSHLCAAAARTLLEKGYTVGFLTTGQLLSMIKSTFNKASIKTEEDILQDLKKLDLLILDDVGSEAKSGNDDWRKSMIFEVVESRSGKPTIYTSNLTDTDLPYATGERVFSRLFDNTKFIDLFTDDFRRSLQIK